MRRLTALAILLTCCLATSCYFVLAQELGPRRVGGSSNTTALMLAKLSTSHRIVEGMMANDFGRIRDGASQMASICSTQNWPSMDNELVAQWRGDLRRTSLKMARLASEQNIEGIAHTYTQMLGTCIDCHNYSREVLRLAQRPNSNSVVPIPVVDSPQQNMPGPSSQAGGNLRLP